MTGSGHEQQFNIQCAKSLDSFIKVPHQVTEQTDLQPCSCKLDAVYPSLCPRSFVLEIFRALHLMTVLPPQIKQHKRLYKLEKD